MKAVVYSLFFMSICFFISQSYAEQVFSKQGTCDEDMQNVTQDEFTAATKEGDSVVVSYQSTDKPVLRIMQGSTISVQQDFGGMAVIGKMDLHTAYTNTPGGEVLLFTFRDGDVYHTSASLNGISGNKISVSLAAEDKEYSISSDTLFCVSK